MCGICGQFNFGDQAPVHRAVLEGMTNSIAHRGPDDEGYFISGPLGLGFRRLSIIDLAGGHQPMADREQSVWVVFNGEIYNFPQLKRELESFGHVFHTKCDTEVIIHGYKQWGDEVLNRLNGMFGLAIWDVTRKRLLVARDPFGIKLIYYKCDGRRLSFGSEMRAVLAAGGEAPEVDPLSLRLFLQYRFTPSPRTIFRGVRKLAPGTMLVVENGTLSERRWYRYAPSPFSPPKTIEQATDELAELYKQSIKRHLLSDVPLGLLLSGGVDSSLLLALMNLYGKEWPTYTVGYGPSFADDELADANVTARHFGSRHTEVKLNQGIFEETLPKIVASLEEPIAASSIVPMYFVCQRARRHVKVVLLGQGPDELFGGYRRHLGVRYAAVWAAAPAWVRGPLSSFVKTLPRNETLKRGIDSLHIADRMRRYQQVLSLLPGSTLDGLFQEGSFDSDQRDQLLASWAELAPMMKQTDELGGLQFLELRSTLPDELLMYADKLSMAHGLEGRVPYLDREIVEYVERLPASFKVWNGAQKWLHRRVCKMFLSETVLKRKKRGFAVNVVDDWLRNSVDGKMSEVFTDNASLIYRFLRPAAVRNLFHSHQSGQSDNHKVLFSIALFEQWLRVHSPAETAITV